MGSPAVRDPSHMRAVRLHQIQLGLAVTGDRERDAVAVGRHRRVKSVRQDRAQPAPVGAHLVDARLLQRPSGHDGRGADSRSGVRAGGSPGTRRSIGGGEKEATATAGTRIALRIIPPLGLAVAGAREPPARADLPIVMLDQARMKSRMPSPPLGSIAEHDGRPSSRTDRAGRRCPGKPRLAVVVATLAAPRVGLDRQVHLV